MSNKAKLLIIAALTATLALSACGGEVDPLSAASSTATTSASASASASASPTPTGTPTATCDPKFVQVKGTHGDDGKVDATFEAAIAKATAKLTGAAEGKAINTVLLQHSANNAQRLAIWGNSLGLWATPNDYSKLVSGNCLSAEGQALFYKLDGALNANGVTTTSAKAPASGHNSGIVDNKFVVAERAGIVSSPDAIKVTLKDGSIAYILKYCGNVIFPAPPVHIPTSPKIPQPPAPTTPAVPPVTPVCPPGTTGTPPNCLELKNPAQDAAQNGNAGNGGGVNADPGPGTYIPPAKMVQPPAAPRVNPPAPVAPKPVAPPRVTAPVPGPIPAPLPTVVPSAQPTNNGTVDPNPSKGEPCNPDFQNCP